MYIPPVLGRIVRTGTFTLSPNGTGLDRETVSGVIVHRSGLGCETNHVCFNNGVLQLRVLLSAFSNTDPTRHN